MLELDDRTRTELRRLQKKNRNNRLFIKITVVLMLDQGFTPAEIAIAFGIDESTIYRYQQAYLDKGLDSLLPFNYQTYEGKLTNYQLTILKEELTNNRYITSQRVADFIKQRFNKHYSPDGVIKLLHRLGFVYKKTKTLPAKANSQAQREFLNQFNSLLAQLGEDELIYFNDGVHPLHNTRPDYGWILKGCESKIPANSGRKRININGCVNASDVSDIIVLEDERINAQSTIKLWQAQHQRHRGKTIYNICDNARYYHSKVLKEWLKVNPWCKVIYLPPYAPNLNLIERLWKLLRKEVISYHYYQYYSDFRKAVLSFFKNIKNYEKQLTSLLTLNFQVIDNS